VLGTVVELGTNSVLGTSLMLTQLALRLSLDAPFPVAPQDRAAPQNIPLYNTTQIHIIISSNNTHKISTEIRKIGDERISTNI